MTEPGTLQLVGAAASFLPALVWAIIARNSWRFLRTRAPRSLLFRLLPPMATCAALFYAAGGVISLSPNEWRPVDSGQHAGAFLVVLVLNDWAMLVTVVLANHVSRLLVDDEAPGTPWLVANYGSAGVLMAFTLVYQAAIPLPRFQDQVLAYLTVIHTYALVVLVLVVRHVVRAVRRGRWWPAGATFVARRADVVMLVGGLFGLGIEFVLFFTSDRWSSTQWILLVVLISWSLAVPLAVRILREVVRGVLVTLVMVAAIGAAVVAVRWVAAGAPERVQDIALVFALVAIAVPGQAWLRRTIDDLVFRTPRRQRAELQAFLHTLSPELGGLECCRRALAELARVRQLRGAAVLLRSGEAVVHGDLALAPLRGVWPRGEVADALPRGAFVANQFLELPTPLREALIESDVVAVVPIESPRQRTGHLAMTAGLLASSLDDEEVEALEGFADQLARVLDGADLLARAVAVERSLAHAEKLAAIGELAARIAHEIRNPVTAARSLAQQLAREPGAPFTAEHEVILAELERVERQVADLLRFARRDELRFERVDLGELVRATVQQFAARLQHAGVGVELETPGGINARADRDRLRQVLINLIENAMEALAERPASGRLALAVGTQNGSALVRVSDNGPGVPADVFHHLFEPFFSRKANGTGLGLAIARRTIEAHGGRITAESPPGAGMTFHIELPLGEAGAS